MFKSLGRVLFIDADMSHRCRSGTSDFIAQQLQIMAAMQAEQEQRAKDLERRKLQRPLSSRREQLPSVPPLPQ